MTHAEHHEGSASAKVIADSIFASSRLTSVEVTFPRPFLAEFNTHCRLSRNSASSRAIPVWKRLIDVLHHPYVPNSFGTNQSGMQAGKELEEEDQESVISNWLYGRDIAVALAYHLIGERKVIIEGLKGGSLERANSVCDEIEKMIQDLDVKKFFSTQDYGLHKQHANRVLEPYSFHTVIVTATHWRNFFGLRCSEMAQPEAQDFAIAIARAMMASTPQELSLNEWHLPYIQDIDRKQANSVVLAQASAGKCARVSYLTQDGKRSLEKDVELADRLLKAGHMSPFQHPARPRVNTEPSNLSGNYAPVWAQLRKLIDNEGDFTRLISEEDLISGCRNDYALADFILSLRA